MPTDKLKSCPFCGGEGEIEEYGTCISLLCKDCGIGFDWQVCDVVEDHTKYQFFNTKEYVGYEKEAVDITRAALTKAWNTRVTTKREEKLREALKAIVKKSFLTSLDPEHLGLQILDMVADAKQALKQTED